MPKLYVYLHEDGARRSFEDLSGQEFDSIKDALVGYGDLTDVDNVHATIEVSDNDFQDLLNKKKEIQPAQYGVNAWGDVEVEFLNEADPNAGGRRRRKVRKTRKLRKTRKSTKKTRKGRK